MQIDRCDNIAFIDFSNGPLGAIIHQYRRIRPNAEITCRITRPRHGTVDGDRRNLLSALPGGNAVGIPPDFCPINDEPFGHLWNRSRHSFCLSSIVMRLRNLESSGIVRLKTSARMPCSRNRFSIANMTGPCASDGMAEPKSTKMCVGAFISPPSTWPRWSQSDPLTRPAPRLESTRLERDQPTAPDDVALGRGPDQVNRDVVLAARAGRTDVAVDHALQDAPAPPIRHHQ